MTSKWLQNGFKMVSKWLHNGFKMTDCSGMNQSSVIIAISDATIFYAFETNWWSISDHPPPIWIDNADNRIEWLIRQLAISNEISAIAACKYRPWTGCRYISIGIEKLARYWFIVYQQSVGSVQKDSPVLAQRGRVEWSLFATSDDQFRSFDRVAVLIFDITFDSTQSLEGVGHQSLSIVLIVNMRIAVSKPFNQHNESPPGLQRNSCWFIVQFEWVLTDAVEPESIQVDWMVHWMADCMDGNLTFLLSSQCGSSSDWPGCLQQDTSTVISIVPW